MRDERRDDQMRGFCLPSYLCLFLPTFTGTLLYSSLQRCISSMHSLSFISSNSFILDRAEVDPESSGTRREYCTSWMRHQSIAHEPIHSYTHQGYLESGIHLRMVGGNRRTRRKSTQSDLRTESGP